MTKSDTQKRRLGYARVSTYGQKLDAQLAQLRAEGCAKVYREKASGAKADRRALLKILKDITPGDVVTVTRIDRLARSAFDLFAIVKRIVDAGGEFKSLAEPWADTATSTGRLMLAVLGGLADVERDLIRTRTAEGRSRAKARAGSIWAAPLPSPGSSRSRPAIAASTARRSKSWQRAITSARRRFPVYRGHSHDHYNPHPH
jgi:DNA invertase Pin-like site-specific DNA recombinase